MTPQQRHLYLVISVYMFVASVMQLHWTFFTYDRLQLLSQPWRLWTGHWVHLNIQHLLLNFIALLCLPMLIPQARVKLLLCMLLLLPPCISLLFYVFDPQLHLYAGLSGVLHGVFLACALQQISAGQERRLMTVLLVLMVVKLAYEHWHGASQSAAIIGYPVITQAHLYGALLGLFFLGFQACLLWSLEWRNRAKK